MRCLVFKPFAFVYVGTIETYIQQICFLVRRMSPTEFSNYIKQRQQLQQHNNHYHHPAAHHQNMYGAIGSVSPARSISPNPMSLQMTPNDSSMHQPNPFVFPSNGFNLNMYQSFGSPRNMFEGLNGSNYNQFNASNATNDPLLFTPGKCSSFMDQQTNYCKIPSQQQQQQPNSQSTLQASQQGTNVTNASVGSTSSNNQQAQQQDSKLLDGMNSFYNNSNPSYQHHLLVAN